MNKVHTQKSLFKTENDEKLNYRSVFAYRVSMVKEKKIKFDGGEVSNQRKAAEVIRNTINTLGQNDREHFVVLMLNVKNQIIGINIVSVGSASSTQIRPVETFKPAIMMSAAGIVMGHNHPSGNTDPSEEDRVITQRFTAAAELLQIQVHDHVIVSSDSSDFYSFSEHGDMRLIRDNISRSMKNLNSMNA
ncbi:DNA repair and recombination protein radC domain-containing protein [Desulfonema limicola]|uniref:DNA repair and recombination protein radC domain-containing protein n=1 Tax=Desulfonema limicola TaxID=45656 RepID=A0A975B4M4_9BACT|nr:JAB domain-containing protein [Desulfonema limicola]QTA78710.1 DNA repair and recombination protein radC domain-containing protein [Desulfonema limicola]